MKIKNLSVMNFKNAIRGMRNSFDSWKKSDSLGGIGDEETFYNHLELVIDSWLANENSIRKKENKELISPKDNYAEYENIYNKYLDWLIFESILQYNPIDDTQEFFIFGPNDLALAQKLIKAGGSERKFLRQIFVSMDITAPIYWWKEFDTYKVGTVANSTSTMHTLSTTPITIDCFETRDYNSDLPLIDDVNIGLRVDCFINDLEQLRQKYLETKDKKYWKELIRWLPESWLQTRTVTMNYENLLNIYSQRRNHRLIEWRLFCEEIKILPYGYELITSNFD